MPAPSDPRGASIAATEVSLTRPRTDLEQELQRAIEEIERGEGIVLSAEDVERWEETGVPPWPTDFPD